MIKGVWVDSLNSTDQDERVGTDLAITFARKLTAASREKKLDSRAELHVLPEPRGHTTPRGSPQQAASWILSQFSDSSSGELGAR